MDSPRYPATFDGLLQLVARLRGPDGCPWDKEQDRDSMKRYLLEECYELVEAIDERHTGKLVEELGDVLFHMAFQVQMGVEEKALTSEQVFQEVNEKLVRRHPHVFGDATVSSAREAETRWDYIKQREAGDATASALDGIPAALPALSYAQLLQERAARTGFDWEDVEGVVHKIVEELDELRQASTDDEREREMGDVLFSLVNLCRWLGMDAEGSLHGADARFRQRFELMEVLGRERGTPFNALSMEEKEALWQEAKSLC